MQLTADTTDFAAAFERANKSLIATASWIRGQAIMRFQRAVKKRPFVLQHNGGKPIRGYCPAPTLAEVLSRRSKSPVAPHC